MLIALIFILAFCSLPFLVSVLLPFLNLGLRRSTRRFDAWSAEQAEELREAREAGKSADPQALTRLIAKGKALESELIWAYQQGAELMNK